MNTRSPPAEPPQFRGQTLTPVSPKPLHFPQPANIPVLENQMDPVFNDTATHYPPESLQDNAEGDGQSSTGSLYAELPTETGGGDGYTQPQEAESGEGAHNHHDTSAIQTYAHTTQVPADAPSDAAPAPSQAGPAPSFPYDAYAGQEPPQSTTVDPQPTNGESGGVDFQALLDNLDASDKASPEQTAAQTTSPSQVPAAAAGRTSPASALPVNPNLPPRPPPQDKPNTHPNYTPGDDIRSYHPHSQTTTATQYRNQSQLSQMTPAGTTSGNASGGTTSTSYQQTSVSAMPRRTQSPTTPNYRQRDSIDRRSDRDAQDDEAPWAPEVQKIYDEFLAEERVNVTEGQWDKFPVNSRLFIGNLPTEKVTKRDLFHVFHRHGRLAQISIKQAYGFVQFFESESCFRALKYEQGQNMRGRKMHLEISKPQRNTNNRNSNGQQDQRGATRRRSRSPDYTRGGNTMSAPRGVDRYTGGSNGSPRGRDDGFRRRDDYRPGRRSPSPRGWGRRDRSRDRYDGRRRSRSRSPYGRRYRSPSPQRNLADDLPLPRRKPDQVPDVQILVPQPQDTNRDFMAWVERGFTEQGVTCDVLLLSQKLDEGAVIRRQIVEGVLAISRIVPRHQQTGKIALQIFNRSAGADKVSFEEYDNLDPSVCAQLVLRAKATNRVPPTPQYPVQQMTYGMPLSAYGMPPAQARVPYPPQPNPQGAPQNLSNAIANLDSNGLQKLLATIQPQGQSQHQAPTASATSLTPEISRMLGNPPSGQGPPTPSYGQPPSYPGQAPQGQQSSNPYASLQNNPALASLLGGQLARPPSAAVGATPMSAGGAPQQQQQQAGTAAAGQTDMQEIMAQLAKYRR